jgi:hypothetical protein
LLHAPKRVKRTSGDALPFGAILTRGPEQGVGLGRLAHARRGSGHVRWLGASLLALVLLLVSAVVTVAARRSPAVSQPVAFSHRKHTKDLQLPCALCHKYFNSGAHSGLPDAQTCGVCHSVPQGKDPEAARLTELLQGGQPLRFNKLFRLPDYVFYTHRRHVAGAGLECVNCHSGIADTERPPERPLVEITMAFCVDCHLNGRGVSYADATRPPARENSAIFANRFASSS